MKNIVVYLLVGAMIFSTVIFIKKTNVTSNKIETIEHALKPHYNSFVKSGWMIVDSAEAVVIYRKHVCNQYGLQCELIYLSVTDGVVTSITAVK